MNLQLAHRENFLLKKPKQLFPAASAMFKPEGGAPDMEQNQYHFLFGNGVVQCETVLQGLTVNADISGCLWTFRTNGSFLMHQ